MATMTAEQKKAAVDLAWATYRAEAQAIPSLPWDEFLNEDEKAWRKYRDAEHRILNAK